MSFLSVITKLVLPTKTKKVIFGHTSCFKDEVDLRAMSLGSDFSVETIYNPNTFTTVYRIGKVEFSSEQLDDAFDFLRILNRTESSYLINRPRRSGKSTFLLKTLAVFEKCPEFKKKAILVVPSTCLREALISRNIAQREKIFSVLDFDKSRGVHYNLVLNDGVENDTVLNQFTKDGKIQSFTYTNFL